MDVVILAGGTCPPDLQALTQTPYRSEISFNNQTFLQIAEQATAHLTPSPVIVTYNPNPNNPNPIYVTPGDSFVQSLANTLPHITTDRFLFVTADLPFLSNSAIDTFIKSCDPTAELCYPIIPLENCEANFPGLPRTTVKLKEGTFTGGNIALINTKALKSHLHTLEAAYAARKRPLALARMVGLPTLWLLMKTKINPKYASIDQFQTQVSKFLQMNVQAIITQDPSIGTDIDNAEQYQALLSLKNSTNLPTTNM